MYRLSTEGDNPLVVALQLLAQLGNSGKLLLIAQLLFEAYFEPTAIEIAIVAYDMCLETKLRAIDRGANTEVGHSTIAHTIDNDRRAIDAILDIAHRLDSHISGGKTKVAAKLSAVYYGSFNLNHR